MVDVYVNRRRYLNSDHYLNELHDHEKNALNENPTQLSIPTCDQFYHAKSSLTMGKFVLPGPNSTDASGVS